MSPAIWPAVGVVQNVIYTPSYMDLAGAIHVEFPSRWRVGRVADPRAELDSLGKTINEGREAIAGTYMRMCDVIRQSDLTEVEIYEILSPYFPQPRISEILRVSRASHEVYMRYTAGFFGFKAALRECRGYQVTPSAELIRRKIRRTAARLIALMGEGEIRVSGKIITIQT